MQVPAQVTTQVTVPAGSDSQSGITPMVTSDSWGISAGKPSGFRKSGPKEQERERENGKGRGLRREASTRQAVPLTSGP